MSINRRSFLKSSLTGAAGLSLTPAAKTLFAAPQKALAWTDRMAINPDISNMKVVCFHDPAMAVNYTSPKFNKINAAVDTAKVSANMDLMAMELSGKNSADEAWKTIFRSGKAWSETRVAIKACAVQINNMPRVAIFKKITDVLVNLGVQPENIVVYDGHGNAAGNGKYTPFASLTDETKIRARVSDRFTGIGGTSAISFPGVSNAVAAGDIVAGAIDIIVNIAVHRGHDQDFNGKVTLCQKNHYGTFVSTRGTADIFHSTEAFFNINKHEVLLGGTPVRQQLCIIDSIFAAETGPFETEPDAKLDRIIMGTFAGAVDYCCVKKVRLNVPTWGSKWKENAAMTARYLTEYGFAEADVQWTELTPVGSITERVAPIAPYSTFSFSLTHPSLRRSTIRFTLPGSLREPVRVRIIDMRGSLVRELRGPAGADAIQWDGRESNGRLAGRGNYVVELTTPSFRGAENMILLSAVGRG